MFMNENSVQKLRVAQFCGKSAGSQRDFKKYLGMCFVFIKSELLKSMHAFYLGNTISEYRQLDLFKDRLSLYLRNSL